MATNDEVKRVLFKFEADTEEAEKKTRSFVQKTERDVEKIGKLKKAGLKRQLKDESDFTRAVLAEQAKRDKADKRSQHASARRAKKLSNDMALANKIADARERKTSKLRRSDPFAGNKTHRARKNPESFLGARTRPKRKIDASSSMFATGVMTPAMQRAEAQYEKKVSNMWNGMLKDKEKAVADRTKRMKAVFRKPKLGQQYGVGGADKLVASRRAKKESDVNRMWQGLLSEKDERRAKIKGIVKPTRAFGGKMQSVASNPNQKLLDDWMSAKDAHEVSKRKKRVGAVLKKTSKIGKMNDMGVNPYINPKLADEWMKAKDAHKSNKMKSIFRKAKTRGGKTQEPFGATGIEKQRASYVDFWSKGMDAQDEAKYKEIRKKVKGIIKKSSKYSKKEIGPKYDQNRINYQDWWAGSMDKQDEVKAKAIKNKVKKSIKRARLVSGKEMGPSVNPKIAQDEKLLGDWLKAKETHKAGKMKSIFRKPGSKKQGPAGADSIEKQRASYVNFWENGLDAQDEAKYKAIRKKVKGIIKQTSKYSKKEVGPQPSKDRISYQNWWSGAMDSQDEAKAKAIKAKAKKSLKRVGLVSPKQVGPAVNPAIAQNEKLLNDWLKAKDAHRASKSKAIFRKPKKGIQGPTGATEIEKNRASYEKWWTEATAERQKANFKSKFKPAKAVGGKTATAKYMPLDKRFQHTGSEREYKQYQAQKKEYEAMLERGFKAERAKRAEAEKQKKAEIDRKAKILEKMQKRENAEERAKLEKGWKTERAKRQKAEDDEKRRKERAYARYANKQNAHDRAELERGFKAEQKRRAKEAKDKWNAEKKAHRDMEKVHARAIEINKRLDKKTGEKSDKDFIKGQKQTHAMKTRGIRNTVKARRQKTASLKKDWDTVVKAPTEIRNDIGSISTAISQAVGELSMFAGALMMVGMMAGSAFTKLIAVGDAFAQVENEALATQGIRESIRREGGLDAVKSFDKANTVNRRLTGMTTHGSGAMLSRGATQIREMGGTITGANLENLAFASRGAGALTGKKSEDMFEKVIDVAKKGKGQEKLGLASLKLTKSMDENLQIIADAMKADPVAGNILKKGSVESAMERIKNTPMQLLGNVFDKQQDQVTRIYNSVGDKLQKMADNPKVIYAWERALTNLEHMVDFVFTDERLERAGVGASKFAAELSNIGGNMILAGMWMLENSDTVMDILRGVGLVTGAIAGLKVAVGTYKLAIDLWAIGGSIVRLGKAAVDSSGAIEGVSKACATFGKAMNGLWLFMTGLLERITNLLTSNNPLIGRLFGGWLLHSKTIGQGSDDISLIHGKTNASMEKKLRELGVKTNNTPTSDGIGRDAFNSIYDDESMRGFMKAVARSTELYNQGYGTSQLSGGFQNPYNTNGTYMYGPQAGTHVYLSGDLTIGRDVDVQDHLSETSGII